MTAKQNGKGYWNLGTEQESQQDKIDLAARRSLERFQLLVKILVDLKATETLSALQECTNQIFRQADTCLAEGKTMTIRDGSDSTDPGWN